MVQTMILNFEQVRMRLQHGERRRITLQPAAGGKDRRRDAVVDKRIQNARIGAPAAGVQRQRDADMAARMQVQRRFDQRSRLRRTGGEGEQKEAEKAAQGGYPVICIRPEPDLWRIEGNVSRTTPSPSLESIRRTDKTGGSRDRKVGCRDADLFAKPTFSPVALACQRLLSRQCAVDVMLPHMCKEMACRNL